MSPVVRLRRWLHETVRLGDTYAPYRRGKLGTTYVVHQKHPADRLVELRAFDVRADVQFQITVHAGELRKSWRRVARDWNNDGAWRVVE